MSLLPSRLTDKIRCAERSYTDRPACLAAALTAENGWKETASGKLAIVVTQPATNLVKHAQRGEIT